MKIGRNDPCLCGIGKKYKQCCLKSMNKSEYDMIRDAVTMHQSNNKIVDLLCNLYRYMNEKQWIGACPATCAVLYVAIKKLGIFNPRKNKAYIIDIAPISQEIIDEVSREVIGYKQ